MSVSINRTGDATTPSATPPRFRRPRVSTVVLATCVVVFILHGLTSMGIDPRRLLQAPERVWDFLARAVPPATDRTPQLGSAMVETLQMAVIGTILGVVLSIPVAILAARNTSPHRAVSVVVTSALTAMRSIPDLVWALVFVISVGLGPLAGILTIMVDVLGFAGRFFAQRIEEVEEGPVEALKSTGAGRISVIACAVVPTCFPSFIGTSLYSLEKSVRGAVVLGLVGAGGIGVELNVAFQLRRFDTALTIILMILIVVLLTERFGAVLRNRLLTGTEFPQRK